MITDYRIDLLNGFVNLDTLSPDGKYYYRISKPEEQYMDVFSSDLSYFDRSGKLLYTLPKGKTASYFPPFDSFYNVKWFCNGEVACHIEYTREESKLCFLILGKLAIYRRIFKDAIIMNNMLDNASRLNSEEIKSYLENLENIEVENIDIEHSNNYGRKLFTRWYPR